MWVVSSWAIVLVIEAPVRVKKCLLRSSTHSHNSNTTLRNLRHKYSVTCHRGWVNH